MPNINPNKTYLSEVTFSAKHLVTYVGVFALLCGIYIYSSMALNPNLPGDVNGDNIVDSLDLSLLLKNYDSTTYKDADFDNSGKVDVPDLSVLLTNYGKSYTATSIPNNSFSGMYYDNSDFTNLKLTKIDSAINFDWLGGSPDPTIDGDTFSVRWEGNFTFENATYTFTTTVDDGARLYIDNQLIIDKWLRQSPTTYTASKALTAGSHTVRYEYYEEVGGASVNLSWTKQTLTPPPPPPSTTPTSFQLGSVAGGAESLGLTTAQSVGIKLVRSHDKSYNVTPSSLDSLFLSSAQKGIELILLVGFDAAPPDGGTMGDVAARFGPGGTFWQTGQPGAGYGQYAMRYIEWGNENSYTYGAKPGPAGGTAYANSFKSLYDRVKAKNPNVKLLAQGDDGGTGSSQWSDLMFSAQPNMKTMVDCWVVHPYGPPGGSGVAKLDRMVATLANKGVSSTVPICITEDGISSDNGRCLNNNYNWPLCMTYDQAGIGIKDKVNSLRAKSYGSRILTYIIYKGNDNKAPGTTSEREDYFGIKTNTSANKGGYTTAIFDLAKLYPPVR